MSRAPQDIDLFNGRIIRKKCEQFFKGWVAPEDIDMAFIYGPEQMTHDVSDALQSNGLAKDKTNPAAARWEGGKVDMDANHAREDYEVARGFALSCQSFPVTEKVVMDLSRPLARILHKSCPIISPIYTTSA